MAPGEPVVVVHSVINRSRSDQFVVVEYSLTGSAETPARSPSVPPGSPRLPIRGALVTIQQLEGSPCAGRVDTLLESSDPDSAPGVYSGSVCAMVPGSALRLRVVTPAGEEVTGTTRIPEVVSREVRVQDRLARFALDTLDLNRDRDTIFVSVTANRSRVVHVEARQISHTSPHDPDLFLFTDTTRLRIAGRLSNPFQEEAVFLAGRYYAFTVAVGDTNYYDYLRSRSDPFTGRGYINRLKGGIGVFGAVDVASYVLRVVADWKDQREGVYRITGNVAGSEVDLEAELYLNDRRTGVASAFLRGQWIDGFLDASASGTMGGPGENPNQLSLRLVTGSPSAGSRHPGTVFHFYAVRSEDGSPFPVQLLVLPDSGSELQAELTMVQVKFPFGRP
ncbi:MAG: hypothetical protein KatS3mg081_1076 [Gemmatimonadales bacterium]|nr:MAG: hypothetical protein KatS3mg081_1076 [Gemmatimonadales bacterium]